MKDYYQIFGVNRNSTQEEIDIIFNKIKKLNQLTIEMYNIYHVLSNTTKREKYNELYDKETRNGKTIKNYYIEIDGKLSLLSENTIRKLKEEYHEKKTQEQKSQEQKSQEQKSPKIKNIFT